MGKANLSGRVRCRYLMLIVSVIIFMAAPSSERLARADGPELVTKPADDDNERGEKKGKVPEVDLDLAYVPDNKEESPGATISADDGAIALYCRDINVPNGTIELSASGADHIEVFQGETKIIDVNDTSESWSKAQYGTGKTLSVKGKLASNPREVQLTLTYTGEAGTDTEGTTNSDKVKLTVTGRKITIIELTFSDDVALKKNKGTANVPDKVYVDSNADGDTNDAGERDEPGCYVKSTRPKVTITFKVEPEFEEATKVWIKGKGMGNDVDFATSKADCNGQTFTISNLQSVNENEKVANAVAISEAMIAWTYCVKVNEPDAGEYISAGYSSASKSPTTKLYIVLDTPSSPLATPWTEVLDLACTWAVGTTQKPPALTALTEALYGKGSATGLWYDYVLGQGSYEAGNTTLKLTKFLTDIETNWRQKVNCADCCNIVNAVANAIGIDAKYRRYVAAQGNHIAGQMQLNAMDFI